MDFGSRLWHGRLYLSQVKEHIILWFEITTSPTVFECVTEFGRENPFWSFEEGTCGKGIWRRRLQCKKNRWISLHQRGNFLLWTFHDKQCQPSDNQLFSAADNRQRRKVVEPNIGRISTSVAISSQETVSTSERMSVSAWTISLQKEGKDQHGSSISRTMETVGGWLMRALLPHTRTLSPSPRSVHCSQDTWSINQVSIHRTVRWYCSFKTHCENRRFTK